MHFVLLETLNALSKAAQWLRDQLNSQSEPALLLLYYLGHGGYTAAQPFSYAYNFPCTRRIDDIEDSPLTTFTGSLLTYMLRGKSLLSIFQEATALYIRLYNETKFPATLLIDENTIETPKPIPSLLIVNALSVVLPI